MAKKNKLTLFMFLAIDAALLAVSLLVIFHPQLNFAAEGILAPRGFIAEQQKHLIIKMVLLMLIVVAPVLISTYLIAFRYRAGNKNAAYAPDWDENLTLTALWWAMPASIILAVAVLTWNSAHALDPYKPINSNAAPIKIQVVSLRWKWLFIYPDYNIAAINLLEFPQKTPLSFTLTSDAPMNSFWIPQLGGQIYTMAGMTTQLHLLADQAGEYQGSAAEINGAGFSGMKFLAKAVSEAEFEQWVKTVRGSSPNLNMEEYSKLAQPSQDNPAATYSSVEPNLYGKIIQQYMPPANPGDQMQMQ